MNREEIIRMAREANIKQAIETPHLLMVHELERFAALVAAAEREKLAAWMIKRGYATGHGDTIEDLLVELEWQVRESEREACAKVCDEMDHNGVMVAAHCATAIRARGQA
jgi:hypothetical protein